MADFQEHILHDRANWSRKNSNAFANHRAAMLPLISNGNIEQWQLTSSRSSTRRAVHVSSTLTEGSSEDVASATSNEVQHTHDDEGRLSDSSGMEHEESSAIQVNGSFAGWCMPTTEVADDMVLSQLTSPEAMIGRLNQIWSEARGARQEGDIMRARDLLEGSLAEASRALKDGLYSHSKVGSYLADLGNICWELGDNDEAVDYYKAAVKHESISVVPKPRTSIVLGYLEAIGRIYVEECNYSLALYTYKEVYDIQLRAMSQNSLEVASTLCNMGLMHYLLQAYRPSLRFYQETLKISLCLLDSIECHQMQTDPQLCLERSCEFLQKSAADSLNVMGLLYCKLGQFGEAENAFSFALSLREKVLGLYHKDVTALVYSIAKVRVQMGGSYAALQIYLEGLRRDKVGLGDEHHPDLSLIYQNLGGLYNEIGDIESSLQCFQAALKIECTSVVAISQGVVTTHHSSTRQHWTAASRLLNVIGNIHLMMSNIPATMHYFVEAARTAALGLTQDYQHAPIVVTGHLFCYLTRSYPPCASAA